MSEKNIARKGRHRQWWLAGVVLFVLFGAAAAWKWTPLADEIEIRALAGWAFSIRNNPARSAIILAAYVVGSIVSLPITVLIVATALVFGAWWGSVYSLVGCLLGAVATYGIGYFLGKDFVKRMAGRRWKVLEEKIDQTGILAVATLRLIPVAPFTMINVVSGAFQVPMRDYLIGSLLGLLPGILVINLFARQMENAIRNPGIGAFSVLAVLVVASIVGLAWLRRKFSAKDSAVPA